MSLLPKQLAERIPEIYQTEYVPLKLKLAMAKLFHPASGWTWYVIEYDGEDECWGLVDGNELEFGYFSLSELDQPLGVYNLPAELDKWFQPTAVRDLPINNIERVVA